MYNTSSEYRGLWHSIICPCDVLTIIKKRVPMDLFSSSLSQANSEHPLSYMNVNFHTVKKTLVEGIFEMFSMLVL